MRQGMSMRRIIRPAFRPVFRAGAAAVLIALASACATAPSSTVVSSAEFSSLALCSGVSISNAPATDNRNRIVQYDPQAYVRGKTLLRAPVKACVSSGFGPRRGGAGAFHHGVDLYPGRPEASVAGGDGVVETVGALRGYGKTVLISHGGGVKTRYAHLSAYAPGLKRGVRVAMGSPIGRTGATGNASAVHLHYEIMIDGKRHNPLTVGR